MLLSMSLVRQTYVAASKPQAVGMMLNSGPKGTFTSKMKPAEDFGSFLFALIRPRVPTSLDMQNVVTKLPTRSQGEAMLEFFFDEILWIYHIVHVPTVRRHFDKLYNDLQNQKQLEYGPLALISTLFALTAYFSSETSSLPFKHGESMAYCHRYILLYVATLLISCLMC